MEQDQNKPRMSVTADETKAWRLNDHLHREDGPAIERPDGRNQYWLFGNRVTKERVMSLG